MIDSFSIGGRVNQKISFPLLVNWLPSKGPLRGGRKGVSVKSKFRYFHIIRILFCCTHKFYYSINPAKLKKNTKLLQKNKEHFIIHFFDLLLHNLYKIKIFLHGGSYSTTSSPIEVKRWTLFVITLCSFTERTIVHNTFVNCYKAIRTANIHHRLLHSSFHLLRFLNT